MPSQAIPVDYDPFASDPLAPRTLARRNDPRAALARLDALALDPHAGETLTPYQPTWQDRLTTALIGPNTPAASERGQTIGKLMSLVGLTPVGAALATQAALQHGDRAGAALAAFGAIPGVGPAERGALEAEQALTAGARTAGQGLADVFGSGAELPVSLESRTTNIYNPPSQPPRPFEADYPPEKWPNGPPVDAQWRLTHDIGGRPIEPGASIAGRNSATQGDQAPTSAELATVTKGLIGSLPQSVPESSLSGERVGQYGVRVDNGKPSRRVEILDSLIPADHDTTLRHEIGHMMDDLSGTIDPYQNNPKYAGLMKAHPAPDLNAEDYVLPYKMENELATIYNDFNNPMLARARAANPDIDPRQSSFFQNFSPTDRGYPKSKVNEERWAEAFRAYLTDPNYIKTVAPNVAVYVREAWNSNPELARILHLNSLGPLAAAGAGAAAYSLVPVEGDPFAGQ